MVYGIEEHVFGVCTYLGKRLGIRTVTIRLYFVYLSFFTFGSPIIIYLFLAFIIENKNLLFPPRDRKTPTVWEID